LAGPSGHNGLTFTGSGTLAVDVDDDDDEDVGRSINRLILVRCRALKQHDIFINSYWWMHILVVNLQNNAKKTISKINKRMQKRCMSKQ